ncbi:uncharacterized protein CLAFUR5_13173 [Fulvia fulva]|uniref:Uncharacterized protein n=1 Tax=Passalora fulva TaxID=5499 RepID=A0A9Q8PKH5_PASFU|nr:uncharacterized protein CLAFUR5_13173 [Fulvia fulva]UJO24106.1 hypothetical protein CLAFUR5_13173 [Fulvia fulva]
MSSTAHFFSFRSASITRRLHPQTTLSHDNHRSYQNTDERQQDHETINYNHDRRNSREAIPLHGPPPPELKNRIYSMLLENDTNVEISSHDVGPLCITTIQAAILRTCRQVNNENCVLDLLSCPDFIHIHQNTDLTQHRDTISKKVLVRAEYIVSPANMTNTAAEIATEKPFRFMDLPPELRNRVYSLILENDDPFILGRAFWATPVVHTAILRTCQQVRSEATSILYGNNIFGPNECMLAPFLEAIGPSIKHIRTLWAGSLLTNTQTQKFFTLLKGASLAKTVGPLFRCLHKNRKREPGYKVKDVLDVLVVYVAVNHNLKVPTENFWEKAKLETEFYGKKVKELVGATLK